jgi:tRNA-uridine 2-sulfurtransferase
MRIAVALSGGVDSAVAAALLRRDGHDVVGVTLQQWPRGDEESSRHGGCCSLSAVEDARRVAGLLDVPYYVWNMEREFGARVIEPFHQAYLDGRTPNPCLRCNAFVRFDLMLRRVLDLGFDALATGHYARVVDGADGPELHAAADPAKDQSYVLYHLDRERLSRIRFPLGELTKPSVRAIARSLGLPVADKRESMEICFVPRGETAAYLAGRLPVAAGEVVDSGGRVVGEHRGTPLYTVGQRTGLGQLREPGPWYVAAVEAGANRLVVGRREELAVRRVRLEDVRFTSPARAGAAGPSGPLTCEARLRYRARPLPAVYEAGGLTLEEPFYGAAPGQAAVLYQGTRVVAGGTIVSSG